MSYWQRDVAPRGACILTGEDGEREDDCTTHDHEVVVSDSLALDAIAEILRDPEWASGMLEDIGLIVSETGRDITGDGTPTWERH